ncbi:MAG: hypothetical protein LBI79_05060 [Nitrososphaerota archaeon]|jgi:tRNA threonylcarbamoyladenosine modification (KEOPS) complex  Pcc1 subunit|nr:hypothetical protein [Nitrososphaerota archaeon]
MSKGAVASICLNFNSEKQLDTLLVALAPEAEVSPTYRSTVKLKKEGRCLTLMVVAEDAIALRATLNAYLRWVHSILKIIDVVEKVQVCCAQ